MGVSLMLLEGKRALGMSGRVPSRGWMRSLNRGCWIWSIKQLWTAGHAQAIYRCRFAAIEL